MYAVLDFETLHTEPNTYILSAGFCAFDPSKQDDIDTLVKQSFHIVFDERGQEDRVRGSATMAWWKEQSPQAWEMATMPEYSDTGYTYPLACGLIAIREWCKNHDVTNLIGNGVGFDNAILKHACAQTKIDYPLPYWSDLDLRTMKALADIEEPVWPSSLIKHFAKDDAIHEAYRAQRYIQACRA